MELLKCGENFQTSLEVSRKILSGNGNTGAISVGYELLICSVLFFIVRGSSRYEKLFTGFLIGKNFGKQTYFSP
jgi:hypothetical protein